MIPLYLTNSLGGNQNQHRLYEFYVHSLSAAVIFYAGYLWLVPKFFLQERKMLYFIILVGLILGPSFLSSTINEQFFHDPVQEEKIREAFKNLTKNGDDIRRPMKVFGFYNHILISVLISGFALGFGVMSKLKQNEEKQKDLEKEKLNSELAFLKNQISPHFFFNTLNNIYSLIEIDQHEAQASVHKLSKLMRYLLYESELGESTLADEVNFMNHYIDLMKLRLSNKVNLSVSIPDDAAPLSIPPLLFVPFIENAFKHGVSYREPSFISISMLVEGTQITFQAKNSLGSTNQPKDEQHSGIGLENVKKAPEPALSGCSSTKHSANCR